MVYCWLWTDYEKKSDFYRIFPAGNECNKKWYIIIILGGCNVKQVVSTDLAPKAIGPYSQAIKANGFLFISGQIPLDPVSGEIVYGGIESQTYQVLNNLKAILESENLAFANVVKTSVFLKDLGDFATMNKIYGEYFPADAPARACVQVAKLPRDVSVEIELIAVYDK
jgi:2-iminobutanoate/2-iminopropanoate deaminase